MDDFAVKEFNNIIKNQRASERTIIIMAAFVFVIIIVFAFGLLAIVKYYDKTRLVIRPYDNNISVVTRDEATIVEAKSHIAFFCDHFYCFDATNINEQTEKALWVSDNSVKKLFDNYKRDDWYNKIVQINIFQTCQIIGDINVDITKVPYQVSFSAFIFMKSPQGNSKLKFTASCELIPTTKQYPKNQFGFIITNYVQSQPKVID